MKKIITAILAAALLLAAALPAAAETDEEYAAARRLYGLGLFLGRGEDAAGEPDFDLDSPAAREEAVVMLIRLTGNEESAEAMDRDCPFTDVSDWAKSYVAHAAYLGLVKGRRETLLDARSDISATEYLTMVLRALRYRAEAGEEFGVSFEKDFDWDRAWLKSDEIGLTNGEYSADTGSFTRGDMARVSAAALDCALNGYGGGSTLLGYIDSAGGLRIARNVESFTAERYDDGERAYPKSALRLFNEEFAGERLLYVHMDDLCLLLAAAAGALELSADGGVSARYTQSGAEDRFTRDYGAFRVEQNVRAVGMMIFAKELTISAPDGEETRALTVTAHPRPQGGLWRLHLSEGVRYFYADELTRFSLGAACVPYVNADDVLSYFGFDPALSVREDAEGFTWSLTDGYTIVEAAEKR